MLKKQRLLHAIVHMQYTCILYKVSPANVDLMRWAPSRPVS